MSLTLRYTARSDRGLIREANEDSAYAGPRLLAVADGMGGMAAGEVASNIVIAALAPLDDDAPSTDLVAALRSTIEQANQQLRQAVDSDPALEGMGTTLTAMLFTGNRIALVHVGDSRAYVLHDGELTQITRDDTYVQMLVDEGRITTDEAHTHPQRSLLTRALDGREVEPDFSIREARLGDRYLLCSDGLSGVVSPETMAEALQVEDPRAAADRLIALALRGGGPDNVTCIVADIVDAESGDEQPVVGGAAAHDRGRATAASADSAAGRAALASPQSAPTEITPPEPPATKKPRTGLRIFLTVGVAAAVLAIGGYAGWQYTQQQYYIGERNGRVAIYRGVQGSIAGLNFSSIVQRTDLRLNDLDQVTRRDVENTIWAKSQQDAREKVDRLRDRQLPPCDSLKAQPSPTAAPEQPTPTPRPSVNCRETKAGSGGD